MLTTEHVSRSFVLVLRHQHLAVLRVLILQVEYVECGAALVGPSTLRLHLLYLYLVRLAGAFIVHEFPAFHVPVILLHSLLLDVLHPLLVLLLSHLLVV